ncbi:hypothetical protein BH11PSE3_BH11PSE3_19990 [soil metagenome]
MPSAYQIVANTPLWVWPLMLFVLALGLWGLKSQILPPARLAILPLVGLGTSMAGIAQSLQPGLAAAGWGVGLLLALPVGHAIGSRRAVRRRAEDGRLEVAGGWFALVFGLSIFAVRYALGVLFGILPVLRAEPLWIGLSAGVGGFVAGIGLGWLASLLLRARRPVGATVEPCG